MKKTHLITYLLLLLSMIAPLYSMEKPKILKIVQLFTLDEPALTRLRLAVNDDLIKKVGMKYYTPLIIAVIMGDECEVRRLLSHLDDESINDPINRRTANGHTALHFAVLMGNQPLVNLLLDYGAYINAGQIGQTPYDFAARFPDIRALLIERGASYTYQMSEKVLHALRQLIKPESIASLVGVDCTELMEAVILNDEETINSILKRRPDEVCFPNTLGTTPLHCAALMGNLLLVKLLMDKHESIDLYDYSNTKGYTPLHFASVRRDLSVVHYLITRGANVDALADDRWWPLDIAIQGNRLATIYLLLQHGSPLDLDSQIKPHAQLKDEIDRMRLRFGTPFDSERIKALLQHQLERAAALGNAEEVRRLLEVRPPVVVQPWYRRLIQNYSMRSPEIVPEQSSMYIPEQLGEALCYAVCRYPEVEKLLIDAGAHVGDGQKIARAYKIRADRENDARDEEKEDKDDGSYQLIIDSIRRLSQAELSFSHNICPARSQGLRSYLQLLPPQVLRDALAYRNGGPSLEQECSQRDLEDDAYAFLRGEAVQNSDSIVNYKPPRDPMIWRLFIYELLNQIKMLLNRGAYPNPQNEQGENLFDALAQWSSFRGTHLQCIDQLLEAWEAWRPRLSKNEAHLDFGLRVRLAFLEQPAVAHRRISELLVRPQSSVINNQIQLVYNFLMREAAMQSLINPRSDYASVIDLLLQRHPNLDFQLARGLALPSLEERSQYIFSLLNTCNAENIDQFYVVLLGASEPTLFENRATIRRLLEKWPHKIVRQKLAWVGMKFEPRRLIRAVKKGDVRRMIDALADGANHNKATIDGYSLIEFIALYHSGDFSVLNNMIIVLLDHEFEGNPIRDGEELMVRLLTPSYNRFVEQRAPILVRLLDELERRGHSFPQVRMRLRGMLMGAKQSPQLSAFNS